MAPAPRPRVGLRAARQGLPRPQARVGHSRCSPAAKCEQNRMVAHRRAQKLARKEYSFLAIEKTIGNSMSLARSSSTCAGELLGWSRPRLLLEDAPHPSRRVRDPAVGCLGAGMYQRGRVHGAPPPLAPLRSRRRRLRPAPNYGAAPQAGGLERPAGCTDGLCVCAQLDLLYDVIRIQAQNQAAILADVQALCVRHAPSCPAKASAPLQRSGA